MDPKVSSLFHGVQHWPLPSLLPSSQLGPFPSPVTPTPDHSLLPAVSATTCTWPYLPPLATPSPLLYSSVTLCEISVSALILLSFFLWQQRIKGRGKLKGWFSIVLSPFSALPSKQPISGSLCYMLYLFPIDVQRKKANHWVLVTMAILWTYGW